jgi:hypothetical protein
MKANLALMQKRWLTRLIWEARASSDDLWCLDRDGHSRDEAQDCSWCLQRIKLRQAVTQAEKQVYGRKRGRYLGEGEPHD